MQGRIKKVIDMKPLDRGGMIAEAAGTKMYENKEQQCVKTIQKKDAKLAEIDRVMKEDIEPNDVVCTHVRARTHTYTHDTCTCAHIVLHHYTPTHKVCKVEPFQRGLKTLKTDVMINGRTR